MLVLFREMIAAGLLPYRLGARFGAGIFGAGAGLR